MTQPIRQFETGATRNSDEGKHDIAGFNSVLVDHVFHTYMHKHRKLEDGSLRAGDNWQKGIPPEELFKSLLRHVHDVRLYRAGHGEGLESSYLDALNAVKFNINGLILAELKEPCFAITVDRS